MAVPLGQAVDGHVHLDLGLVHGVRLGDEAQTAGIREVPIVGPRERDDGARPYPGEHGRDRRGQLVYHHQLIGSEVARPLQAVTLADPLQVEGSIGLSRAHRPGDEHGDRAAAGRRTGDGPRDEGQFRAAVVPVAPDDDRAGVTHAGPSTGSIILWRCRSSARSRRHPRRRSRSRGHLGDERLQRREDPPCAPAAPDRQAVAWCRSRPPRLAAAVRVEYHSFHVSSSSGPARPHDGSARVRCGLK